MANDKQRFGISFTDNKHYDLDEMIESKDRQNSNEELVMQVESPLDSDPPELSEDGNLIMPVKQAKIKIKQSDIRKYLFDN